MKFNDVHLYAIQRKLLAPSTSLRQQCLEPLRFVTEEIRRMLKRSMERSKRKAIFLSKVDRRNEIALLQ